MSDPHIKKEYIGDGVYASHDGWHFVLETERATGTDKIFLDPEVLAAFQNYVERTNSGANCG